MENIRYGRLEFSDQEVFKASRQAHCHEFVEQLSEKYETLVGERGIKLSGGQRQRIAIARAFVKRCTYPQAAIGCEQLKKLPAFVEARKKLGDLTRRTL